jgi:hypothetical protein
MREPPDAPPAEIVAQAHLVRLPLTADVVLEIQRRAARRGQPMDSLSLAHELGDVRFAAAFAPDPTGRPRWQGAFSVFSLLPDRPALLGYTVHHLDTLKAIPPPSSWPGDPILWDEAEATPLLARLERRCGLHVPFSAEFWPCLRVVDPAKPARGQRRIPRVREVDIARHLQATQPELDRPAAYATWLSTQISGGQLDMARVRLAAEITAPAKPGSFSVISVRLTGSLRIDDPALLASPLLRGIGRRRAYGLGLVAVG